MDTEKNFEKIFKQYENMIKKQIKTLHIYKNHDEFFQIGMIALWEAMQRYDQRKGNFSAYAYVTVRGKMLEQLKKEKRYGERHTAAFETAIVQNAYSFSETLLEEEQFQSYLAPLSKKQKTWAIEAILNQKTITEIAEEHGATKEAVKSWRKEALKKLRKRGPSFAFH